MSRTLHVVFLVFVWLACARTAAQPLRDVPRRVQFDRLLVEQGLSQGSISALLQDSRGFLWIGTDDGLNRFDGYEFLVFRPDPSGGQSLASNSITALGEDADGHIWIGTAGSGYQSYDPDTRKFISHPLTSSDGTSLAGSLITVVFPDRRGRVWIGTDAAGLHFYDPASGTLVAHRFPGKLPRPAIHDIAQTRAGTLLVAAGEAGLWLLDPGTGAARAIDLPFTWGASGAAPNVHRVRVQSDRYIWVAGLPGALHRLDIRTGEWKAFPLFGRERDPYFGRVQGMDIDSEQKLWIATPGLGLFLLDTQDGSVRHITENRLLSDALPNNSLRCVYHDRLGNVWVGSNGSGLALHSSAAKEFNLISAGLFGARDLPIFSFRALWMGRDSVLWLGGYGGLIRYDRRTQRLSPLPKAASMLSSLTVYALHPDPADSARSMIVGTEGRGLYRLDVHGGRTERIWPTGSAGGTMEEGRVFKISPSRDGNLWIGTSQGLLRWNRTRATDRPVPVAPGRIGAAQGGVYAILEDRNGLLWVGTSRGGLALYDRLTDDVTYFTMRPGDRSSIASNNIKCVYEDSKGRLWIGTAGGLHLADREHGTFRRYTTDNGLPNNVIYGILEDHAGQLWLSTNYGLARFSPERGVIATYDVNDGLQGNEFNTASYFSSAAGELFFGGVQGVTYFHPERITRNTAIPPVVVTGIRTGNTELLQRGRGRNRDTIRLGHQVESIAITFAALNYYRPEKNRYRYRIVGISQEFVDLGTERLLSFAGLSPGSYELHIQASNNDGVWNLDGLRLILIVEPPFWATWWFRLMAGMLIAGMVFGGLRWRIARVRQQEILLAAEVEHRTQELQHANSMLLQEIEERKKAEAQAYHANTTKSEFLAHISHEIRTPMNAILGFTELLQDRIRDRELREYLRSIFVSGKNLLTLINDMLDLSKIEAGRLELVYKTTSIRGMLDEIRQLFAFQVREKGLTFEIQVDDAVPQLVSIDEMRLRQILLNLVGNAVKFTDRGGIRVEVESVETLDHRCTLTISVRDTGVGIPPSQQERVFEPFRQAGGRSRNADYGGTGLGLAITERLVEMMGGRIRLSSRLGVGSTFTITLPAVLMAADDPEFPIPTSRIDHEPDTIADETDPPASRPMQPDARPEELAALLRDLRVSELPRWERLKRTFIIHEIESFALGLLEKSQETSFMPLIEWSERLLHQARSFDMERLPITLDELPGKISLLAEQAGCDDHTIEGRVP